MSRNFNLKTIKYMALKIYISGKISDFDLKTKRKFKKVLEYEIYGK